MKQGEIKAECKAQGMTLESARLVLANADRVSEMVDIGNTLSTAVTFAAGAYVDNSAFDCIIEENGQEKLDPLPK